MFSCLFVWLVGMVGRHVLRPSTSCSTVICNMIISSLPNIKIYSSQNNSSTDVLWPHSWHNVQLLTRYREYPDWLDIADSCICVFWCSFIQHYSCWVYQWSHFSWSQTTIWKATTDTVLCGCGVWKRRRSRSAESNVNNEGYKRKNYCILESSISACHCLRFWNLRSKKATDLSLGRRSKTSTRPLSQRAVRVPQSRKGVIISWQMRLVQDLETKVILFPSWLVQSGATQPLTQQVWKEFLRRRLWVKNSTDIKHCQYRHKFTGWTC